MKNKKLQLFRRRQIIERIRVFYPDNGYARPFERAVDFAERCLRLRKQLVAYTEKARLHSGHIAAGKRKYYYLRMQAVIVPYSVKLRRAVKHALTARQAHNAAAGGYPDFAADHNDYFPEIMKLARKVVSGFIITLERGVKLRYFEISAYFRFSVHSAPHLYTKQHIMYLFLYINSFLYMVELYQNKRILSIRQSRKGRQKHACYFVRYL